MKKFWYRVELDAKGTVVSSRQVAELDERDGSPSVYFFASASQEDAEELAYREYHRVRQEARRAAYKAQGRCKCGRSRAGETQAESAFVTCPKCRTLSLDQHRRAVSRAKGIPAAPELTKADHFANRRNDEKLELLKEVQDKFLRSNMTVFGKWLNAEIAKLEPKPAPKLRAV